MRPSHGPTRHGRLYCVSLRARLSALPAGRPISWRFSEIWRTTPRRPRTWTSSFFPVDVAIASSSPLQAKLLELVAWGRAGLRQEGLRRVSGRAFRLLPRLPFTSLACEAKTCPVSDAYRRFEEHTWREQTLGSSAHTRFITPLFGMQRWHEPSAPACRPFSIIHTCIHGY